MKTFRVVNINRGSHYRIDQRHSMLFGLSDVGGIKVRMTFALRCITQLLKMRYTH